MLKIDTESLDDTPWAAKEIPAQREREDDFDMLGSKPARPGTLKKQGLNNESVYKAVQHMVGSPDVLLKSIEQKQGIHAVVKGQSPLVVVLPTGGGKSLLFMVPAYLDRTGVTVLVLPFRALIDNMMERIINSGVECIEWKPGCMSLASIVVVSADFAGREFVPYAKLLCEKKLLRRVVVDECHLIFTSSHWRPKLAALRNLRVLSCPIILLTATLPPVYEQELNDLMDIRCATYIRASTVRPNIRYMVSWCKSWEGQATAVAMCRRQLGRLKNRLKGIV